MDIKDKIIDALFHDLEPDYILVEDDDGISGFVVSRRFEGVTALDRQEMIESALDTTSHALTPAERRTVLMIAGLTPTEYEAVGARIRIQKIRDAPGGAIEVLLHGGSSDAEYVRGTLNSQKGVKTTDPKRLRAAGRMLMSFRATGTKANPLTKQKAVRALKSDPYILVMESG